jgi:hypothetical protein
MADKSKKGDEEEGGEFADFMAVVAPRAAPEPRKTTPMPRDGGLILEWENLADRMIEDMR